jgi:hypothetical protein
MTTAIPEIFVLFYQYPYLKNAGMHPSSLDDFSFNNDTVDEGKSEVCW